MNYIHTSTLQLLQSFSTFMVDNGDYVQIPAPSEMSNKKIFPFVTHTEGGGGWGGRGSETLPGGLDSRYLEKRLIVNPFESHAYLSYHLVTDL